MNSNEGTVKDEFHVLPALKSNEKEKFASMTNMQLNPSLQVPIQTTELAFELSKITVASVIHSFI